MSNLAEVWNIVGMIFCLVGIITFIVINIFCISSYFNQDPDAGIPFGGCLIVWFILISIFSVAIYRDYQKISNEPEPIVQFENNDTLQEEILQ